MPKFKVCVEKTQYLTGVVTVQANNASDALAKIDKLIDDDKLKESRIKWDAEASDDESGLRTTGDVDDDSKIPS